LVFGGLLDKLEASGKQLHMKRGSWFAINSSLYNYGRTNNKDMQVLKNDVPSTLLDHNSSNASRARMNDASRVNLDQHSRVVPKQF